MVIKLLRMDMHYKITPIRRDFLIKVREVGIDDQNQAVVYIIAEGGEPCRDVLRRAKAGEELILASYCPFTKMGPYKEYGAVFVLKNESNETVNYSTFSLATHSEGSDYFGDYLSDSFVVRAYDNEESIYDARLVSSLNVQQTISEFFAQSQVKFIMARYAAYGCYALRLDRN